jgi:hypothetical protein
MPDWSSKHQNQLKATSIAFCGSSETVASRLSCSVLDFPILNQALNLLCFACRSNYNQQEHATGHLLVGCFPAFCLQDNFECKKKNKINLLI